MQLRIVWEPGLPARRDQLLQRMPAGAEHATIWNGYMDGAVRSGEAAAQQVSQMLRGEPSG